MTTNTALSLTVDEPRDGVLTLKVAGELDYDTDGTFTRLTGAALDEHRGVGTVLLDCAELDHVDSMGLSALLMLRRRLDQDGLALRITGRSTRLDRLLSVTGTFEHLVGEAEPGEGRREQALADAEDAPRGPAG
ncbi:STAS domain-containing protein [Streptomyces sp. NPDC001904]|uniref:STAS domain-containing protein n=1 Tax=Streptomyces sp. NPDC001904 TaxID=3154531 RepID=UPI00332809F2